jgi:hypothetical protein
MAIDLKKISSGRVTSPPRVCWYSADGVGKTTAMAQMPDPFIIDLNHGSEKHDVKRVYVNSWDEYREWLTAIETGQVQCGSVGTDSLTELEAMLVRQFAPKGASALSFQDREVLIMQFRPVLMQLERIWLKGKVIAFSAHQKVKRFSDPTGPSYDRFQINAEDSIAGAVREWCDFVLFCREELLPNEKYKNKASTDHVRWQYTRRTPMFDAKSRGITPFPERLPLGYASLVQAIEDDEKRVLELRADLAEMLAEIGDEPLTKSALEWDKKYPGKIVDTHNRIKERLAKKRGVDSVEKPTVATVATETEGTDGKAA